MIKAVYFDLDNTLVDRAASIDKFTETFLDAYRSRLDKFESGYVSSLIKSVDNGGYLPKDSRYTKVFEAIGEELVLKLPWRFQPTPKELSDYWKSVFPQSSIEMAGAKDLLQCLHTLGYFIGIISNGAQRSREEILASTSFSRLIGQLVSSESFGTRKPDPEIFIKSVAEKGFRTDECIYVGDHPVNDMQGASSAGMKAILVLGFHSVISIPKDTRVVNELAEVLMLVQSSWASIN